MTGSGTLQGAAAVDQLCQLGRVSRAGYYRFLELKAPARADADLRDAIHRIALAHKHYGYRPVTARSNAWASSSTPSGCCA